MVVPGKGPNVPDARGALATPLAAWDDRLCRPRDSPSRLVQGNTTLTVFPTMTAQTRRSTSRMSCRLTSLETDHQTRQESPLRSRVRRHQEYPPGLSNSLGRPNSAPKQEGIPDEI